MEKQVIITRLVNFKSKRTPADLEKIKYIEKQADITPLDSVCGILQFDSYDSGSDTYSYTAVGNGCITIYFTDCSGNLTSETTYQCINGNQLNVTGCHSFNCGC